MASNGSGSADASSREVENTSLEEVNEEHLQYPLRPYELDCVFFLKHGFCRYGSTCRFNHPVKRMVFENVSRRIGRLECKYFSSPGGCRKGNSCKFAHCPEKTEVGHMGPWSSNFIFRAGGQGSPLPNTVATGRIYVGNENGGSENAATDGLLPDEASGQSLQVSNNQVPSIDVSSPYMPIMVPPQINYWSNNGYQDQAENTSSPLDGNLNHTRAPTENGSIFQYESPEEYDEMSVESDDSDEPEDCPALVESLSVPVGPTGLPLRPDQPVCPYYSQFGLCIFGIGCRNDHPVDYGARMAQSSRQVPSRENGTD